MAVGRVRRGLSPRCRHGCRSRRTNGEEGDAADEVVYKVVGREVETGVAAAVVVAVTMAEEGAIVVVEVAVVGVEGVAKVEAVVVVKSITVEMDTEDSET